MINYIADYQRRKITSDQLYDQIVIFTFYFVALGAGMLVCSYIYSATYVWSGERQTRRLREAYLKAVIRQDMPWFDSQGAGEGRNRISTVDSSNHVAVTTRITSDTLIVQDGISEKLSFFIMNIGTFVGGFVIAFTTSWKMTLVLVAIVPLLAITVGVSK